jgi:hypothetical protein
LSSRYVRGGHSIRLQRLEDGRAHHSLVVSAQDLDHHAGREHPSCEHLLVGILDDEIEQELRAGRAPEGTRPANT